MLDSAQTVLARLAVSPRCVYESEREGGRRDAWAGDEGLEPAWVAGDSMRHGAEPKHVGLKHGRSKA
jgi:hypothetical protein